MCVTGQSSVNSSYVLGKSKVYADLGLGLGSAPLIPVLPKGQLYLREGWHGRNREGDVQ